MPVVLTAAAATILLLCAHDYHAAVSAVSDAHGPFPPRCCSRRPSWNESSDPDGPDGPNARFKKAMSLTGGELVRYVQGLAQSWWPARAIVAESLAKRKEDHPSGEVRLGADLLRQTPVRVI